MRFTIMVSGGLYGLHIKAPLAAFRGIFNISFASALVLTFDLEVVF
jgi:hypothetical protein